MLTDPSVQEVRKSISATVHVKAILSKLADELGGGAGAAEEREGKRAVRINLQTVHNIYKVMRNLEVTMKNVHVRVEEPARAVPVPVPPDETEAASEASTAERPPTREKTSTPGVAFGICLKGVSLGLDERADAEAEAAGGSGGGRWFGKQFRAMETALLGNLCETLMDLDG